MADSNSNSYGIRVPKYNGKGGVILEMGAGGGSTEVTLLIESALETP